MTCLATAADLAVGGAAFPSPRASGLGEILSSSAHETTLWRLLSGPIIIIFPPLVQHLEIPKRCRATIKTSCLVFVKNSERVIPVFLREAFEYQIWFLRDRSRNFIRMGLGFPCETLPRRWHLLTSSIHRSGTLRCSANSGSKIENKY